MGVTHIANNCSAVTTRSKRLLKDMIYHDFNLHFLPETPPPLPHDIDDYAVVVPVNRFLLSQRSLFFKAALTFPLGNVQDHLEFKSDFYNLLIISDFFVCLQTGVLNGKPKDIIDWYALADCFQCLELKETLKGMFFNYLLDMNDGPVLLKKVWSLPYTELITTEALILSFKFWVKDQEILDMLGADALEDILKVSKGQLSMPKEVRWGVYQMLQKIIEDKYADANEMSDESINSIYIASLPSIPFEEDEEDRAEEDTFAKKLQDDQYLKKVEKSLKLKWIWKFMPWQLFPAAELLTIMETNPKAPREIIEKFIISNKHLSYKCKWVHSRSYQLKQTTDFPRWYEEIYADMTVEFLKGGEKLPAHKSILSDHSELWQSAWDEDSTCLKIKEPDYYYERSTEIPRYFLRLLYGKYDMPEGAQDQDLFNLLMLFHYNHLKEPFEYISEHLIKNEKFVWDIFAAFVSKYSYFIELFPTLASTLDNEKLLVAWNRLQPMTCISMRIAWLNMLSITQLKGRDFNVWANRCAEAWFGQLPTIGYLNNFQALLLTLLNIHLT